MVHHFSRFIKQVNITVTLCTRILEVLGSNVGQVYISPFRQIRDST
jgi:hypothetical protein